MAVVATGFFDGVHLGHRHVIQALVSFARERGEEAIAVTFMQHPRAVLQQDAHVLGLLNSPQEKEALLRGLGVDRVEALPFDRNFAQLNAEEYIRDVLVGRFSATALVLGYDNRLGSDRLTPDRIKPLAESMGLEVIIVPPALRSKGSARENFASLIPPTAAQRVPPVYEATGGHGFPGQTLADATYESDPDAISSTKIREALRTGRVEEAEEMLGYAYALRGVVVGGKQLGRKLGFPTANLRLYDPMKLVPARGVYLTEVEVLGKSYWGMTNVGDILETHIFDFSEDIYGLDLGLRFRRFLREMRAFEDLDALQAQLSADAQACRALIARSV
ncbi:MAG: bifunctional riboflavin kinase/FMN adenylyltransferase [Bacteroidales bacterium]|nr:bifunctional riboflavin kinase/FMN adenylyltransferase [Bacteroidales bacterium]